jgi:lipopolysaccharide/colanic/teichoic acid biosynthesis glycosyltransferase
MDSRGLELSDRDTRSLSILDLNGSAGEATAAAAELVLYPGETYAREIPAEFHGPLPRWKRVLDIMCTLMALPALLPLLLLIALLIKLKSPGPALFKQERVGYRGKRFKLLKFRSMKVGADTVVHQQHFSHLIGSTAPMVKLDAQGDQRLIPYGRLLRASGLDELPQIINVLRGEMSLVGPRPCIPYEYDKYLPWQKKRFEAVPGLTGLWQVSGKNKTTFDEMVYLDIHYARNKSLWLDIKIILRTLPAVIGQIQDIARRRKSHARVSPAKAPELGLNNQPIRFANELVPESSGTTEQIWTREGT